MIDRNFIFLLSTLLLIAVSYVQVFHKISNQQSLLVEFNDDFSDNAEEGEKSTEENARETDQDEDPFNLAEMTMLASSNYLAPSKNENYFFGHFGYYPEIVSPPPQV